jgi:N-acetyl-anhydromuramyl-L-alanine amidase AmpD
MTYALTWLADVLRMAGCKVVEQPDWKSRGRAEMGTVKGVLLHHTAGALHGDHPSLELVEHGRPDLAGPLSHLLLSRDGTFFVLAAGRCNHAGAGVWHGITDGNGHFIGIEAENAGTGADPWPEVQMDAYTRGVAAILSYVDADSVMAAGHKEYAIPKGRKIDPSFDMIEFRANVEALMGGHALGPVPAPTDPKRAMLRKGDQGQDVRDLQAKLNDKARADLDIDGNFGPGTETAVKRFQSAHGLTVDGLVGPATWTALG